MQLTHNDGDRQSHHPPAWCHVYKSTNPSSIRTQACSIAYIEASKSSIRNRNRRANTKLHKQQRILVEVIVPTNIKQNLLSELDTDNDIVVVDGGDVGNPPISPPDDVKWHCLSIHEGNHLHVQDETNPHLGLTSIRVGGCLPFIRMPRQQSLDLIRNVGMSDIVAALEACEELKPTPLKRGGGKQVFGDYGKRVQYTSAGVQVSRNSSEVLKYNTYLENLPVCHRLILMKLMTYAELSFESLVDHEVLSHVHHAKQVVPFNTMNMPSDSSQLKYYGALAFGCNVFLRCHTDDDFTMSMIQVHLKGKDRYDVNDDIVVYFCFPTLGCAVPLRPGDFLIFNALIPHCVSSRCRQEDDIMITSAYLKTSVVGMNNNKLPVTSEQSSLADKYRNSINN